MVLDAERQDQLRRRDEGRGVLEARLPVDAHHAEGERIVLVDEALRVQSIQDRRVGQSGQPCERGPVAQRRLCAQRDDDARRRPNQRRDLGDCLAVRAPAPHNALLGRGGTKTLKWKGRRGGLDVDGDRQVDACAPRHGRRYGVAQERNQRFRRGHVD